MQIRQELKNRRHVGSQLICILMQFLFDLSLSPLPLGCVMRSYSMMSEEFDEFLFMTDDTAIKKLLSAIIILIRSHNYT